ncbi:hypothetical protein [Belliella aquatica]|uniref:Uncharacterized protein n=1 Tax=Belliella aquatica TaxID=1323734 RepID=A0ABQ1N5A0_9BACT|nr:hypothetical protein [Belliella aquatica]MCH7407530.1 hypothetical protein [Belliella aquatica]GGC54346.1 hypothetical protein GCM10010993_35930 [Belliella aquatica]
MKKLKLFTLGIAVLGSFSLAFTGVEDPSLDDGGSVSPLCATYATDSNRFNCKIRQTMSETTCYFSKVKSEFGGVN